MKNYIYMLSVLNNCRNYDLANILSGNGLYISFLLRFYLISFNSLCLGYIYKYQLWLESISGNLSGNITRGASHHGYGKEKNQQEKDSSKEKND